MSEDVTVDGEDELRDELDDVIEPDAPVRPERVDLPEDHPKRALIDGVREALQALPFHFHSTTVIEGIEAGDLFALNSVLGGTIEIQAVAALNQLRGVWDPNDDWEDCAFVRSSQTFPDVRLIRNTDDGPVPELGIELKGWYLLSREKMPSFRYKATPSASTEYDLIAVYPWYLTNLLSGTPLLLDPYIEQSRYAALARNYYWQVERGAAGDATVTPPAETVTPYPGAKVKISDKVKNDSPGNFGRLARAHGLMADFCAERLGHLVAGIPARDWIEFLKSHTDAADPERVHQTLVTNVKRKLRTRSDERAEAVLHALDALVDLAGGPRGV